MWYGRQVMIYSPLESKKEKDADHAIINHFAFFQAANDVSIQDNKTRNNSLVEGTATTTAFISTRVISII